MTDHDTGGTLDGWDDELNDWTEDDHVTMTEATRILLAELTQRPLAEYVAGIGDAEASELDKFADEFRKVNANLAEAHAAHADVVRRFDAFRKRRAGDRAQQAYNAVTNRGYCDEAP